MIVSRCVRNLGLALLVAATVGGGVRGVRADEPLPPTLTKLAAKVTQWITTAGSTDAPPSTNRATSMSLDRSTKRDLGTMAGRLAGARLLAISVYNGKPATLASDLSRQLRVIDDVPADKLQSLVIDASKAKRADEVACDWACDLLESGSDDPVIAAVYWFADERTHSLLNGAEAEPKLHLVLIRLSAEGDGELKVARVVWGPVTAETVR